MQVLSVANNAVNVMCKYKYVQYWKEIFGVREAPWACEGLNIEVIKCFPQP